MVYKWYILPIWWLYITYHLLREPETTIDLHFQGPVCLVSSRGQRRHPCECGWGQPHRRRPGIFLRCDDEVHHPFWDVMKSICFSFSSYLNRKKHDSCSWYMDDIFVYADSPTKSHSTAFFPAFHKQSEHRISERCLSTVPRWCLWRIHGWLGMLGCESFFVTQQQQRQRQQQQQQQQQIFDSDPNVFSHSFRRVSSCQTCISYMSNLHTTYQYPWTPKPMNVMKVLRPQNMGEIYNPPKKEGYGFPWYIICILSSPFCLWSSFFSRLRGSTVRTRWWHLWAHCAETGGTELLVGMIAWRIIHVSEWLITMVSKSPK